MEPHEKRAILTTLVDRIERTQEMLVIRVLPRRLLSILRGSKAQSDRARSTEDTEPVFTLVVSAQLERAGMETKLLINGAAAHA